MRVLGQQRAIQRESRAGESTPRNVGFVTRVRRPLSGVTPNLSVAVRCCLLRALACISSSLVHSIVLPSCILYGPHRMPCPTRAVVHAEAVAHAVAYAMRGPCRGQQWRSAVCSPPHLLLIISGSA